MIKGVPPSKTESGIILFLDENLSGKTIPSALAEAGIAHETHTAHFKAGILDVEWLPEVGRRGWIAITKDARIRYNPLEIETLRNARVGAFVLSSDNLTGAEIAQALVAAFPKMEAFVLANAKPFIGKFYRDGRVVGWKNFEEESAEL